MDVFINVEAGAGAKFIRRICKICAIVFDGAVKSLISVHPEIGQNSHFWIDTN